MSLKAVIQEKCPVPLSEYMTLCLAHPQYGYYQKKVPFGREGDFVTAPDISQMFGEIVGACLIQSWLDQRQPTPFILAELGPGRGTLMADILRTARKVAPAFAKAAAVYLVETSPILREIQKTTVPEAKWVSTVKDLPEAPLFFVANEFFDALPIKQYIYDGSRWLQRYIDNINNAFAFVDLPCSLPAPLENPVTGQVMEVCPLAQDIMSVLLHRITPIGGGLIFDYGYTHKIREEAGWPSTFQAMHRHTYVNPLEKPGDYDLTAHVDFTSLMQNAPFSKLQTQGEFLQALGIYHRAETLFRANQNESIFTDLHRLTASDQMGVLFKVLGVCANKQAATQLAGF